MKRAVIFDYGGVLMKTMDYGPRHAWDDRLGLVRGSVEKVVHGSESWLQVMVNGLSLSDYWSDVARQLKLDAVSVKQLAVDFYSGDRLDETLIAYIRQLRAQGHAVALLSNASLALSEELAQLGIKDLFNPLVISAQIGFVKPDAQAFQEVVRRLNRSPGEMIFVDDAPVNVEAANSLGIHGILYRQGMDLPAVLAPLLNTEA